MARRYSHRPLFPNPVVSFFLFWLGYILNGSTLPPSVTFCTARYAGFRSYARVWQGLALTACKASRGDVMYVILGATGNTGSIIANSLLLKGEKVRVVGRDAKRLQRFVRKGAEAFTANVSDAAALTDAFKGARAAYLMLPPSMTSQDYRADQERESDAIAKDVKEAGLRYAVHLSSYGAHVPEGTGPVAGLHSSEEKLNAISRLNVLHLRAAYFMENNLAAIGMIHGMGLFGNALLPDVKLPMIATRDVGDCAAQRLMDLDFSGKQTRALLGERDLSMTEAVAVIAR